jgi:hypothetical protein
MSRADDRADMSLPVTAEVGSEGGSFAVPTMQVATFRENEPRHDRPMHEDRQPSGSEETTGGMRRYPTEAPPAASTAQPAAWRASLAAAAAGAAAGAVVAYGLMKRRGPRVD